MNELLDKSANLIDSQLAIQYTRVAKNIISECENLYLEIIESGHVLSYSEMMRYDRYFKILSSINQQLKKLGMQQIGLLDNKMIALYNMIGQQISGNEQFAVINKAFAEEAIKRAWCADGKIYSDRVWDNMNLLQSTLQTGLVDCIVAGKSHEVLKRELQHRFNVSQSDAQRLARTELNYIQAQGALRAYQEAGYSQYKFLAAHDERTSEICRELNGRIFDIAAAKAGENLPPMHPNCRSTIIGYKEETR